MQLKNIGTDNFTVEILEECEFKDLDSRECFILLNMIHLTMDIILL